MAKANAIILARNMLAIFTVMFILFSFALSSCGKGNQRTAPNQAPASSPSSDNTTSLDLDLDEDDSLVKGSDNTAGLDKGDYLVKGSDNTAGLDKGDYLVKRKDFEYSLVGKYLKAKGCKDNEIMAMQGIEKETYGPEIYPINFTGNHFNYANCEGQTNQNCGLYAAKRLLHHLGQLGHVSADLWYRYSDEELRDMVVIVTRNSKMYRNQNERLTYVAVAFLFVHIGLDANQLKLVDFTGWGVDSDRNNYWLDRRDGREKFPSWLRPISTTRA